MRLLRILKEYLQLIMFALCVLPVITEDCGAQQRPLPVMHSFRAESMNKQDATLPWLSEYTPPFIYQVWWREIADCEGLKIPPDALSRVQYFQVNAPTFIPEDLDGPVFAVTYDNGQTYIGNPYIWNKALVMHEFLHMLLKWSGDPLWYAHDAHNYLRFTSCGLRIAGEPPENK